MFWKIDEDISYDYFDDQIIAAGYDKGYGALAGTYNASGKLRLWKPGVYSIPQHSGHDDLEYAGFNVDWIARAFDAGGVLEYG